jgi:hypothetical protein
MTGRGPLSLSTLASRWLYLALLSGSCVTCFLCVLVTLLASAAETCLLGMVAFSLKDFTTGFVVNLGSTAPWRFRSFIDCVLPRDLNVPCSSSYSSSSEDSSSSTFSLVSLWLWWMISFPLLCAYNRIGLTIMSVWPLARRGFFVLAVVMGIWEVWALEFWGLFVFGDVIPSFAASSLSPS